jgi:CRM1 C terminal
VERRRRKTPTTSTPALCLYYQCYWPHEAQVQENAAKLLLVMARRRSASSTCQLRACMVASPIFIELVKFHCITAGISHLTTSHSELQAIVQSKWAAASIAASAAAAAPTPPQPTLQSMNMILGYQRLPYRAKSRILTVIIVACSSSCDTTATLLLIDALKAVHDAFGSLIRALDGKQQGAVANDDINVKEMAVLCLEMFCGVAAAEASTVFFEASSQQESCIVPQFITPHLPQLAALMRVYGTDFTVCETLLRFFCTYTEQYIAILNRHQSLQLFNASAQLLQYYSAVNQQRRVVVVTAAKKNDNNSEQQAEEEEEQAYNDILCAIQLLINLGTKDFIDACSSNSNNQEASEGVDSSQVTDMIFLGLQQILPLMTQGLLQFPTLCLRFFDLVGFMADTYPDKVCQLPYELFDSLLQALLFGMTHHNTKVANVSLHGLASIAREHLQTQQKQQKQQQPTNTNTIGSGAPAAAAALDRYLAVRPDLLEHCIRQVLTQVVFRPVVLDRVEAAGMAVLPLAAAAAAAAATTTSTNPGGVGVVVDNGLVRVVRELNISIPTTLEQQERLQQAFSDLFLPDRLMKAAMTGYEGRMNRVLFKEAFQDFVNQVYSFLVIK